MKKILDRGIEEYLFNDEIQKIRRPGVVGCYISHILAINDINPSDSRIQLILEDDIEISSIRFFLKIYKSIHKLPVNWDILLIDCHGNGIIEDKISDKIYYPTRGFPFYSGTHSVLINVRKKEHILRIFQDHKIKDIDGLLLWNKIGVNTYVLKTGYSQQLISEYYSDITMN